MVPSVKYRADQDVSQRTEGPAQVGVDKEVVKADEGGGQREQRGLNADKLAAQKEEDFSGCFDPVFGRMKPHGREPIHFLRAVVNGVKGPDRPQVKDAVANINQAIPDKKND